jgi:hypothetical protein
MDFKAWLTPERILRCVALFGRSDGYTEGGYTDLAVYGDDICIDSRLTAVLMSILDRLGFVVNRHKSFTGSQSFRESCGGYYLDGADVTPLFFRGSTANNRAERLASGIALCNHAWSKGYKNLYRFTLRLLMGRDDPPSSRKDQILFIPVGSELFGVYSASPVNSHLRIRYNADYQRDEWRVTSIKYEYRQDDVNNIADKYLYMRWMAIHCDSSSVDDWEERLHRRALGLINQASSLESPNHFVTGGARACGRWIPAGF